MAEGYNKHVWKSNEVITAAGLNNIEKGVEDAYNRAERHILDILNNSPELTAMLRDNITQYMFSIDEENHMLVFKLDKKDS